MITVEFETKQEVDRILLLLHRDLARCEGSIVLATETLKAHEAGARVSGHKREQAEKTLRSAPNQSALVRRAQKAIKAGLDAFDDGHQR